MPKFKLQDNTKSKINRETRDGVYSVCGLRVRNSLCKSSSVPPPCTHSVYGGSGGGGGRLHVMPIA